MEWIQDPLLVGFLLAELHALRDEQSRFIILSLSAAR